MTVFITVYGIVQGVGYRPFIAGLADQAGVSGFVRNRAGIVEICASGEEPAVETFLGRIRKTAPAGAQVLEVRAEKTEDRSFGGFSIVQSGSENAEPAPPFFPPDLPMCGDCLRELRDPGDRRYRYPFISCASCGPRFTILRTLPYDRENTTMDPFPMCPDCAAEYRTGRRRHAQTISCHDCGPQLLFRGGGKSLEKEAALREGIALLKQGGVVAVKGVGGYQFVCSPHDARAVEKLRRLKGREKKPFAVMFPDCESVAAVCSVSAEEQTLLSSPARPIVLLAKEKEPFCPGVCGASRYLGAFLPCTGLHQLLTDACGPLVVTSGNLTSEPIVFRDEEMLRLRSPLLSGVLYHTREILTPLDDSVARVFCGKPQVVRRSRGCVPLPVLLKKAARRPVFAAGGDLKSCFCFLSGRTAYLSQYFGDMESYRVQQNYRDALTRMETIFGVRPETAACDLHPGYFSSALAKKLVEELGCAPVGIQHHHAHAASVMAEHGLDGCIGAVFDGTGYGTDGSVWGGEFLLCRGGEFRRLGHLSSLTLCGGDGAAEDAALTADCYRLAAGEGAKNPLVSAAVSAGVNTFRSSSMGRLFDAAAAILGVCGRNGYEGECPIALENAAVAARQAAGARPPAGGRLSGAGPYPFRFRLAQGEDGCVVADQADFAAQLLRAARDGADPGLAALGFHLAVAEMTLEVCREIRKETGENRVALSGGVFANLLLLGECRRLLQDNRFEVYLNSAVPMNDGGISLGQAWICAARGM